MVRVAGVNEVVKRRVESRLGEVMIGVTLADSGKVIYRSRGQRKLSLYVDTHCYYLFAFLSQVPMHASQVILVHRREAQCLHLSKECVR